MSIKIVATNRKARQDYFLSDFNEAGIALKGSEIKSIRSGHVSLTESYILINEHEAWLVDAYIAPYEHARPFTHDPRRKRKLLLHRSEIDRLWNHVRQKGVTIIPTKLYLKEGLAKIEIAIAKGKSKYDKRQIIAKRDMEREMERHYKRKNG